ncbi:MAG: hypothetical protein KAI53_00335 [Candidatus Aenigmarchaeota archaeon]|nr:hypothetical protein [Candidatus Aenigmarchaeota archaeon]
MISTEPKIPKLYKPKCLKDYSREKKHIGLSYQKGMSVALTIVITIIVLIVIALFGYKHN